MFGAIGAAAARFRLMISRAMTRIGFRDDPFLILLAILIGVITAAAAVGFHELINFIRDQLYARVGEKKLYGKWLVLLIVYPAMGGLAVAFISRYVMRIREGHGIVDVLESVTKSSGIINPRSAIEKIITSAITIGTGGSAGAEGPIVQIGAGIASGIGQLFRVARAQLPVLIGCGSAAGISAIFNSPIGGVLFTLEVILRDFSIRTFTPVVIASVIANFTTQSIFRDVLHENYAAIFTLPAMDQLTGYDLKHVGHFALLGLACGVVGVSLTKLMHFTEAFFAARRWPRMLKPAIGGSLLGVVGVAYVIVFGWLILDRPKVIPFEQYAMPAFFGDGYGAVKPMLGPAFYNQTGWWTLLFTLAFICVAKLVGTCLTLGSGGAGGIIAPSLFLGAVTGAFVGMIMQRMGFSDHLLPHAYALVGMGAVLAAVVHAPLASILILFEVTRDYQIVLPAMLASIIATTTAQLIFRDSIYTATLRQRGVHVGSGSDLTLLRRLSVEQVDLDPATSVHVDDPLQKILDLIASTGAGDFVVLDAKSHYAGMVVADDIKTALLQPESIPLLLVGELMRSDIPLVKHTDDLASVLDTFSLHDVGRLPVTSSSGAGHVIGLVSRAALMRRYRQAMVEQ